MVSLGATSLDVVLIAPVDKMKNTSYGQMQISLHILRFFPGADRQTNLQCLYDSKTTIY